MTVVDERANLLYRSSDGATRTRRWWGKGGDTTKSRRRPFCSNTNPRQKVETGIGNACIGEHYYRVIRLHTHRSPTYRPLSNAVEVRLSCQGWRACRTSNIVLPRMKSGFHARCGVHAGLRRKALRLSGGIRFEGQWVRRPMQWVGGK